jgi:catechol 2,3-dioxygenase-like lactoylglutathione lyase family enzyme
MDMPSPSPLRSEKIMAFAGTANPEAAKKFYKDTLGLKLISEDGFALAFDVGGIMLRVTRVEKVAVAPYTVLGWQVKNAAGTAKKLQAAGVKFERFPFLEQDALGIWSAPGGSKIAWFKDPDGNTLSIAQIK